MEGPHATASSFMHIGDRITLFHELSNGYLGAEGFSNTQVAIDVDDGVVAGDKTRSESRDAIFVVHGAANYNAAMKIKAYQAKNGMTMDEDTLTNVAKNVLNDEKERRRIADVLVERKVVDDLKTRVTISEKQVSYVEFSKLADEVR